MRKNGISNRRDVMSRRKRENKPSRMHEKMWV